MINTRRLRCRHVPAESLGPVGELAGVSPARRAAPRDAVVDVRVVASDAVRAWRRTAGSVQDGRTYGRPHHPLPGQNSIERVSRRDEYGAGIAIVN